MKTDCQKTLEYLRQSKNRGCHSFDLMHLVGTTRIAARIDDLKKQGFSITSVKEKKGDALGCRYYLHEAVTATIEPLQEPKTVKYYDSLIQQKRDEWIKSPERRAIIELQAKTLKLARDLLVQQEGQYGMV